MLLWWQTRAYGRKVARRIALDADNAQRPSQRAKTQPTRKVCADVEKSYTCLLLGTGGPERQPRNNIHEHMALRTFSIRSTVRRYLSMISTTGTQHAVSRRFCPCAPHHATWIIATEEEMRSKLGFPNDGQKPKTGRKLFAFFALNRRVLWRCPKCFITLSVYEAYAFVEGFASNPKTNSEDLPAAVKTRIPTPVDTF